MGPVGSNLTQVEDTRGGISMKRTFSAAFAVVAALLAVSAPAVAADMPVKAAPVVAAPYNWSGFYVGGNAGWIRDSFDWRYTNPSPPTCCAPFSQSVDDATFGGHAGLQVQFGRIVLGVETAVLAGSQSTASFTGCVAPNSLTIACQIERQTTYTAGGRIGWAWDNWLLFGGGGGAWANVRSNLFAPGPPGLVFDMTVARYSGWYAGGGFEYVAYRGSLADIIVGAEYQHIDLGTKFHFAPLDGFAPSPPGVNGRNISATEDLVRARVSVKWNPFPLFFR
jgi:outer membrane immunogenic protein